MGSYHLGVHSWYYWKCTHATTSQCSRHVHVWRDVHWEAAHMSTWVQELRLRKQGSKMHDGVQIEVRLTGAVGPGRRQQQEADTGSGVTGWSAELGKLSGGQRTLLSLATILAVSNIGQPVGGSVWATPGHWTP